MRISTIGVISGSPNHVDGLHRTQSVYLNKRTRAGRAGWGQPWARNGHRALRPPTQAVAGSRQSKLVGGCRLVFSKRCDDVVNEGARQRLRGSAAGKDRVELDLSRVHSNKLASLQLPPARAEGSHDDARSLDFGVVLKTHHRRP